MLNPRSLSTREADAILAYKRGPVHDSWTRIAERASRATGRPVRIESVDKLVDICWMVAQGRTPRMNIERWVVEAVLVAIDEKAAA